MLLKTISLCSFRRHHSLHHSFQPGLNIICGKNGAGKTSLLESIYLLILGSSFRTTHLCQLIQYDSSRFCVRLEFSKHDIEQTLSMEYNGQERKVFYNSSLYYRLSALLGILQGVIIQERDILLIKGPPSTRRHFLNATLSQISPFYLQQNQIYQKALKERNKLLQAPTLSNTIGIWEEEMAKSASWITLQRNQIIDDLSLRASFWYSQLTQQKKSLSLLYRSDISSSISSREECCNAYQERYQQMREREKLRKRTCIGPQNDDIAITCNQRELKFFGSEGELRLAVLALRLAQFEYIEESTQVSPLLLIDDFGHGLDGEHKTVLCQFLLQHRGQILLSFFPEELSFFSFLKEKSHCIYLSSLA